MIAKVSRESLKSFEAVRLLLPPRKHLIPGSKGVEGGREQATGRRGEFLSDESEEGQFVEATRP